MSKHQKHAKLTLRDNGNYAPNEIAILGTKCNVVAGIVSQVCDQLNNYKLAYFDASHQTNVLPNTVDTFTFHSIGTAQLSVSENINKFNQRIQFGAYDMVFINGNHYQGAAQILVLDKDKEESLKKRLDQLTNVQFVIKLTDDAAYFDFLLEKNPQVKNLLCYSITETAKIARHMENLIKEKIAPVRGLVLAGGQSLRMGKDKGTLNFYGKSQRNVAIEMLERNNMKTYLSVRADQQVETENKITDAFYGLGPYGAICSAFQYNPNTAWFVLATDLPFVNDALIQELLKRRNPSKIATTVKGKDNEFPEPLITIWEPKSYQVLLQYLSQGYSCPRKVLINSDVEIVEVDNALIRNVNTPEDYQAAKKEINE